ncbi:MAG TPA: DUF6249 domain-containing protein [Vicinamibacterales bacterium]|nr:DUF6249 domain-containing protein [Vicinamibacterales bacterium]
MDDVLSPAIVGMLIPIVAIIGGIAVVIVSIINKSRLRELEIRERIAMIERGMVPAPESDPKGFDHAITRLEQVQRIRQLQSHTGNRHRRAGVTLMGVGFGLMVLISLAGHEDTSTAVGVGGFLVVMGLAFFINALFDSRQTIVTPPSSSSSAPTSTGAPPPQS